MIAAVTQEFAIEYQSIATNGANDWKSFKIDSTVYLALANYQDNNSVEINSSIYKWNNDTFSLYQEILTKGASDWEYFEINSEHYLAIANYKSQTDYAINSIIYKWDGTNFITFQEIPTSAAYDWEAFEVNDTIFLAVANQLDNDGNYDTYSTIYKWNGIKFDSIQSILTHMVSDWEFFNINDSLSFIAVANTYSISSNIYKWNGTSFIAFQTLSSMGTTGIESFEIDNNYYLATSNGRDFNSFNTYSNIYKWNGTQFTSYQQLSTIGAFDWEFFSINNQPFLCVANYQDDNNNYNLNSVIYTWDGSYFNKLQEIATNAATDWEYLQIDNKNYLVVAEYKNGFNHNINSKMFVIDENVLLNETNHCLVNFNIKIYPNPIISNNLSFFINSNTNHVIDVEIYDMYGDCVYVKNNYKYTVNMTSTITIPNLKNGVYLCKFYIGNNINTQKIIIQN